MSEGQPQPTPNHSEGGYPQQPFSSFAERLQESYQDLVQYGNPYATPAEAMTGLLGRMDYSAGLKYNTAVQDAANNMKWAFIALTYPNYSPRLQTDFVRQYNQLQEEQREQGESTTGIEVPAEQTRLLSWMLDQIGVEHDFQDGDVTIPFAPMEAKMREVAQKEGLQQNFLPDHETKSDIHGLMEDWKATQEGNEQS